MKVLETDRLVLRWLTTGDAEFILELLNDPSWLKFIGDRGVRTQQDAQSYLLKGPIEMYARLGFGLYLCEVKESGVPIGMCGLIKRDSLDDVDIGFALLPEYRAKGFAYEAASAVMDYGGSVLALRRIVAIVSANNHASTKLLSKIGLTFERIVRPPNDTEDVCLYARNT